MDEREEDGANDQPDDDLLLMPVEDPDEVVVPAQQEDPGEAESVTNMWKTISAVFAVFVIVFAVLFSLYAAGVLGDQPSPAPSTDDTEVNPTVGADEPDEPDDPDENLKQFGRWETVLPEDNGAAIGYDFGMQTVHTLLLPSGKVLMASGSSWRNKENATETYPEFPRPAAGSGLFNRTADPFANENLESYYAAVNNVGLYDPATNEFFRVPHPVPVQNPNNPDQFVPSDLFCSGQIQLPDGNALFFGGTQYYFPYRTGTGTTYIFDWVRDATKDWSTVDWTGIPDPGNDPWIFAGKARPTLETTSRSLFSL
jgi:hypothetical protein